MAKLYHKMPSEIINIECEYDAYCFNEACAYITSKIKDGEKPKFVKKDKDGKIEKKHYKSARDLYKSMGYEYGKYTKQIG